MLGNAVRICEAKFGSLYLREGDVFLKLLRRIMPRQILRRSGGANQYDALGQEPVLRPGPGTGLDRAARTKHVVQIADVEKAARVHIAARRRGGDVAAGGERAAKRNEEELPYCRMVGHWLSNVIPPFIGGIS